jgi:hypothetical protein
MNDPSKPPEHITRLVDKFLTEVGEHTVSALVLIEVPCDTCHGTNVMIEGNGSRMAHIGMAGHFLQVNESRIHAEEMLRAESEMDGEDWQEEKEE